MDITGTLKVKNETQIVSEKFKKREFVLTDNSSQYPQHLSMQLTQDKCGLLDQYNVGDEIKAHINLRGREWSNPQKPGEVKYFNTIEAWRLEAGVKKAPAAPTPEELAQAPAASAEEDLPF